MDGLFGFGTKKANNVKVNVTPSPAAIASTGKTLKNAVANAKTVANALNVVSKQLSEASNNLKNKAPVIANVAADAVKANAPAAAEALKPLVGGANAMLMGSMPKSVIAGGARTAVEEVAKQIKKLSGAARDAAGALNAGVKKVGQVANYVANNAKNVDHEAVNNVVMNATKSVNANVGPLVNTKLQLHANATPSTMASIAMAAGAVATEAMGFSR